MGTPEPEPVATYNPATDAGRVRLRIGDVGGNTGSAFVFTDAEIDAFLDGADGNVFRAAADALRAAAVNEVLTSKVIRFTDLATDGAKAADALRQLADDFDRRADSADDGDLPVVGQIGAHPFQRRQIRGL